jgi:DNA-binding NarL/FixJ family response regulator
MTAVRPAALRAAATRVAVFSTSEVVRHGIVGLLPEDWRDQAAIVSDVGSLEHAIAGSRPAAIIDADTAGAAAAAALTRAHGGAVVVLLASAERPVGQWIHEDADAVLVRDEVDQLVLRMALAAGRLGMRLVPRALPSATPPANADAGPPLGEPARRALALLAAGQRDAEMAHELNLSESAVRKLVQRTVHGMGARTRCQAVAIAARTGQLH